MNIGIVTTWFERGASYVSKQYKEVLEAAGHRVFIYARGGEAPAVEESKWCGERVTWGKKTCLPIVTYIDDKDFACWLVSNEIETVFFNEQRWLQPVLQCREMGVKTGLYVDYYTEDTIRAYAIFDFLICNTKKHYSAFKWHEQAYYIPWGTNIALFNSSGQRKKSDVIRFFTSAGMNPYRKGTDLVINAYAMAQKDIFFSSNSELVIHSQVSVSDFFKSRYDQSKTIENIELLKRMGKLRIIQKTVGSPGLYHEGDVYVYPSRLDGIGLTVAEAVSCGMPIIIPDDAPMNEFLPDEGSRAIKVEKYFSRADGYYWPQNEVSINDLALAMHDYCREIERLDDYRLVSRQYALNNLDWEKTSQEVVDAIVLSNILEVQQDIKVMSLSVSNKNYPLFAKYPNLYALLYSVKAAIILIHTWWRK